MRPTCATWVKGKKIGPTKTLVHQRSCLPKVVLHGLRQHQRHDDRNLRVDGAIYSKK